MADANAAEFGIRKQEYYERAPAASAACPGFTKEATACYEHFMRTGQP
jgi:hypothetical protein